jgi:type IV pilus assembly protein PilO
MSIDVLVEKLVTLTRSQRRGLYIFMYILIAVIYLLAFLSPTYADIQSFETEKADFQKKLDSIKNTVGSISDLESESVQLKILLDDAKEALPEGKEIPELIGDISERGRKVGLEISKFNPLPESYSTTNSFVAEVPIALAVEGSFHDVAIFFDRLSDMDRIVHVKNIDMNIEQEESGRTRLLVEGKAITFRFLSDDEREEQTKNKEKSKKKGRR